MMVPRCLVACLGPWGRTRQGIIPRSPRTPCGKFKITFLKQVGLGKGCEKAFPEEDLNAIFGNSIYIVEMTVFVWMSIKGRVGMI